LLIVIPPIRPQGVLSSNVPNVELESLSETCGQSLRSLSLASPSFFPLSPSLRAGNVDVSTSPLVVKRVDVEAERWAHLVNVLTL